MHYIHKENYLKRWFLVFFNILKSLSEKRKKRKVRLFVTTSITLFRTNSEDNNSFYLAFFKMIYLKICIIYYTSVVKFV